MKSTYSAAEVIELIAAYANSDLGTNPKDKVKMEYPNSWESMKKNAAIWLEREDTGIFYIRRYNDQKYFCTNGKYSNDKSKVASFTSYKTAHLNMTMLKDAAASSKRNSFFNFTIDDQFYQY